MKLNLSENIRTLRKQKNLTQEQLAEALSVTVGAVSKWESGATMPEIETLVRIADFFDLSVDALLGWQLEGGNLRKNVARIKTMIEEKDFDNAITLGEKLLQKHPNNFTAIYHAATAHMENGCFHGNKANPEAFQRARELLERSLMLIDQNTDPEISEWQIKNKIGETYQYLHQFEAAVKIYQENNVNGINDSRIAHIISDILHRPDEALPFIKRSFQRLIQDLIFTMISLSDYYFKNQDHDHDLDSVLWIIRTLESLRPDSGFCDLDLLIPSLMQAMCEIHLNHHYDNHYYDPALAKDWMKRAYRIAKAYDATPRDKIVGCRFLADPLDAQKFHSIFFGNGTIVEALTMRLHWTTSEKDPEYYRIFAEAIREVDEEEAP